MRIYYINNNGDIVAQDYDVFNLEALYRELDEYYEYWSEDIDDIITYIEDYKILNTCNKCKCTIEELDGTFIDNFFYCYKCL